MARRKRICPTGEVFHVLNRAVARLTIFEKPADYAAFMRVLDETWELVPLAIFCDGADAESLALCRAADDQVSDFFRRLTVMHTMRYHAHYKTGGTGHVYQGRFKSFPIQIVPDSNRRAPADGHAVRRTKSGAGEFHEPRGSLGVGFRRRSTAARRQAPLAGPPR